MNMAYAHLPVLLDEVVAALAPVRGEVFVDCTLGGGGHTEALLEAVDCRVVGLDRDPAAIRAATARLDRFGGRFQAVHARFSDLAEVLDSLGLDAVDGVLADLGVSSAQLDDPGRGFSFRRPGPVDMRMDPGAPVSAASVVHDWSEDALADLIRRYGEEPRARRVARAIVAGRPWSDTTTLADAIARVLGGRRGSIHPATRVFQAIRIQVNDELGELQRLLPVAVERLRPGGRLAIISFHSLEDRLVKRFVAAESGRGTERDPYGRPVGLVRLSSRTRAVKPAPDDPNPRARSARLRIATRLPCNDR